MGSWDCYCAICGSALGAASVSERPRIARFRKRRAAELRKESEGENDKQPDKQDDQQPDEGDGEHSDDEIHSIESYDEEHGYDPAILSQEHLEWMRPVHILGLNPDAKATSNAFIAGPGRYWDYGGVEFENGLGDDPNLPEEEHFTCYYSVVSDETPVFPFHWCCFELLLKAVTGTTDHAMLEKDLLYNIFQEVTPDYNSCLELDYGTPDPDHGQFWDSRAGEEILAVQPTLVPQLASLLRNAMCEESFKKSPNERTPPNSAARVSYDPFADIPYDILYKVFCLLPFDDLTNLSNASWPVHVNLLNNAGFWKRLLRHSMPWFFELHELMEEDTHLVEACDPRKLFMWLEQATRPKLWMDGPFLAVANRRRIWGVCEQLADLYRARLARRSVAERPGGMAALIVDHAITPQMPLVVYPPPTENLESVTTQWIRSLEEFDARVASFDAFWDADGSLVGLAVSFGDSPRLFGRDDSIEGVTRETVAIEDPSQIQGLVLHFSDMSIGQEGAETSIRGVTVVHESKDYGLGHTRPSNSRPLLIGEGKRLVGLVGQTASGRICRLGLLQCPWPPMDDFAFLPSPGDEYDAPVQQRCLWKDDLREYLPNPRDRIWNLRSLRVKRPNDNVPKDMLPCEALLWAKDLEELRNITCLSGNVIVGGIVAGKRDCDVLCGASVQYAPEYGQPERRVGFDTRGLEDMEASEDDRARGSTVGFDIDGRGGEAVTSVKVAMDAQGFPEALKLYTNRDREVHWGEQNVDEWMTLGTPGGAAIVGLVLAFGDLRTRMNCKSYAAMSYVGIMTLPLHTR